MKLQDHMKSNKSFELLLLSTLTIAALAMSGCMSTGYNKSDAAARSLESASAEVQAQSHALEVTVATLSDLINNPSSDFKPQFIAFSKALDGLVASAKSNEAAEKRIGQKSGEYFQAWDEELST